MVRELDSGLSSPGSGPGWGHCVVFLGKTLLNSLTAPLSTQVYKWVPAKMLGVTLRWTSIPLNGLSPDHSRKQHYTLIYFTLNNLILKNDITFI